MEYLRKPKDGVTARITSANRAHEHKTVSSRPFIFGKDLPLNFPINDYMADATELPRGTHIAKYK